MWKNIEITVSFIIFLFALIFAIYSFYEGSMTRGIIMLILAIINACYTIKEFKEKREDNY